MSRWAEGQAVSDIQGQEPLQYPEDPESSYLQGTEIRVLLLAQFYSCSELHSE